MELTLPDQYNFSKADLLELLLVTVMENIGHSTDELTKKGIVNKKYTGENFTELKRSLYQKLVDKQKKVGFLEDPKYISAGGYGSVYKMVHTIDQQPYAIKVVPVEDSSEVAEVKVMAKINHPNIVRYYGSWMLPYSVSNEYDDDEEGVVAAAKYLYIQMEFCPITLQEWLITRTPILSPKKILKDLANGLSYLHNMNLVHRDLKTSNILIGNDNNAKIGDFGLATIYSQRKIEPESDTYICPWAKTSGVFTKESDIYSLGIIYFEVLYPMKTMTERAKVIQALKKGIYPDNFPVTWRSYISQMLGPPEKRQSIKRIKEKI